MDELVIHVKKTGFFHFSAAAVTYNFDHDRQNWNKNEQLDGGFHQANFQTYENLTWTKKKIC